VYTVYALVDPRTRRVRYVGLTMKPLAERVRGHQTPSVLAKKTAHGAWLRELRALGLSPEGITLELIPHSHERCAPSLRDERVAERDWIERFAAAGADLTNIVHHRGVWTPERRARQSAILRASHGRRLTAPRHLTS
jgi:hypothetical protein